MNKSKERVMNTTKEKAMKPRMTTITLGLMSALAVSPVFADTTINALFMSQAAYSQQDIEAMTETFTQIHPDISVNMEFVSYEALHDKIVAARGAGKNGYDVVLFDVVWPAEFAKFGLLQDVTERVDASMDSEIFDGAWTTVKYDNKYWGMPWILDTKYLFFNKKILKEAGIEHPPTTLEELAEQAKIIKDKGLVEHPLVWSWSQSEALICDYATLVSGFKGQFFDGDKPAFSTGGALDAINYMSSSLDAGLTNPNSREYLEEDVRKVFSSGDAAFALNWTYMYNLANDSNESEVAGDVGVVAMPGVTADHVSAVNGSMGLGITQSSEHPEESWQYIAYLTSQPVQEQYSKLSLPIWKSSYDKPEVREGQEDLIDAAKLSLNAMFARPITASYPQLSNILQQNIQQVLQSQSDATTAMEDAEKKVSRIR